MRERERVDLWVLLEIDSWRFQVPFNLTIFKLNSPLDRRRFPWRFQHRGSSYRVGRVQKLGIWLVNNHWLFKQLSAITTNWLGTRLIRFRESAPIQLHCLHWVLFIEFSSLNSFPTERSPLSSLHWFFHHWIVSTDRSLVTVSSEFQIAKFKQVWLKSEISLKQSGNKFKKTRKLFQLPELPTFANICRADSRAS